MHVLEDLLLVVVVALLLVLVVDLLPSTCALEALFSMIALSLNSLISSIMEKIQGCKYFAHKHIYKKYNITY